VTVEDEPCSHYWLIETPKGPWSLGTCKKCSKIDAFKNTVENTGWNPTPRPGQKGKEKKESKSDREMLTKEEFLALSNPKVENGSKYKIAFKLRMVKEVTTLGRTEVRKKYGLPETTLRGWLKLYK